MLSLLLPPRCLSCHSPVEKQGTLCANCWRGIEFLSAPWCGMCGTPIAGSTICASCASSPPNFSAARSALNYTSESAALITRLKFHDQHYGAPHFAEWMCRAGEEILRDADFLIPIPLHRFRLFTRRYNQAALLSHAISKRVSIPTRTDLLARIRSTRPQTGLSRSGRLRNVQGAFGVSEKKRAVLASRSVVLIDDVMTTGATIDSAVKALRKGGAGKVSVLTLARRGRR